MAKPKSGVEMHPSTKFRQDLQGVISFLSDQPSIQTGAKEVGQKGSKEAIMTALRMARNGVGTAGLLFAGYIFVMS